MNLAERLRRELGPGMIFSGTENVIVYEYDYGLDRGMPDLVALPAYGISVFHDDQTGLDLLSFGADVWNAGPSPLVVEGFRRSGAAIMDAYQVFYTAGRPAGAVRIGTMA